MIEPENVEPHDPKKCPLCSEPTYDSEGNYIQSPRVLQHVLDNMVAQGLLKMTRSANGEPEYVETESGREKALAILAKLEGREKW